MSQLHAQLQAAHARRQAAENRIMTIHNDTLILDRQIAEARAALDALDHEWEVLQEEEMAARREAVDAIEEIRRLTEDIAMGGSRRNRNRTHRRRKAGNP
jgi:chromosome segregation ATPase